MNPNKQVTLSVDASERGLEAVLLQEDKPVAYASRALANAQRNYAQIEKEHLAIVYGCQEFHQYIYCRTVEVLNCSPAQLMRSRRLKTTLPTTAELLTPQSQTKIKEKARQDQRHTEKKL